MSHHTVERGTNAIGQLVQTSPILRLSNCRTLLEELWLYEYNYILPRTLENLRAKVFNKVGSLVQFHGPLIHLYGPICKNVGVTTYLHIHRHGGRSKNLGVRNIFVCSIWSSSTNGPHCASSALHVR